MGLLKVRLWLVSGAVLSLVLAACGGGEEEAPAPQPTQAPVATTAPGAPTTAPTATPRPTAAPAPTPTSAPVSTGELNLTVPSLNAFALFPFPTDKVANEGVIDAIYDKVLETKKGTFVFPASFATSATASADSKVWTIKVRNNVVFQNGDTATAKDVVFAIGLFTGKESQYSAGQDLARVLTRMETPDDQTVVFTLSEPNIFFPQSYLSSIGAAVPHNVWPQKYIESIGGWREANKKPVGSGPYKFKSIVVGDRIVVEAVDKHWYYGAPRTKTLSFLQIPEESTRIALLKTGGSDFSTIVEQNAASLKASGLRIFSESAKRHFAILPFRIDPPLQNGDPNPLSNEDVRKALAWYAVDRAALAAAFFPISGKLSMDFPVHSNDLAYDPNNKTPVPPYDPSKARSLLAQAGYPRGFELDAYLYRPEQGEAFEAVAVYWEQIGIKVNRIPILLAALFPLSIGAAKDRWKRASVAGPLYTYYAIGASSEPRNARNPTAFAFTSDEPETIRLARAWTGATNNDEYIKAGREYQRYISEHVRGWWHLIEAAEVFAGSSKLPKDWEPDTDRQSNFFDAAARR